MAATPRIPKAQVARLRSLVAGVLGFGIVIAPARASAQSVAWTAGPAIFLDTDFSLGTEVGPGLFADVVIAPLRTVSYFASVSVARTDFTGVFGDQFHRNFGAAALGLRVSAGNQVRVGVLLGLGALAFDDVHEQAGPNWTSSANWEEMLLPGIEVSAPVGRSLHARLSIRHQLTGWWLRIWLPDEGELNHRFMVTFGLGRGG